LPSIWWWHGGLPGRHCPGLNASVAFNPEECRAVYALHGKQPPANPTAHQVLRLIAMLGGFIGRKGDAEPGVKTIWLGLQQMSRLVQAVTLLMSGALGE
jgi:hypothetical protein